MGIRNVYLVPHLGDEADDAVVEGESLLAVVQEELDLPRERAAGTCEECALLCSARRSPPPPPTVQALGPGVAHRVFVHPKAESLEEAHVLGREVVRGEV